MRRWHFDVVHPEFGQRIDDRVDHRSKRRRGAALAPDRTPSRSMAPALR
jgi:hypothetical protein